MCSRETYPTHYVYQLGGHSCEAESLHVDESPLTLLTFLGQSVRGYIRLPSVTRKDYFRKLILICKATRTYVLGQCEPQRSSQVLCVRMDRLLRQSVPIYSTGKVFKVSPVGPSFANMLQCGASDVVVNEFLDSTSHPGGISV